MFSYFTIVDSVRGLVLYIFGVTDRNFIKKGHIFITQGIFEVWLHINLSKKGAPKVCPNSALGIIIFSNLELDSVHQCGIVLLAKHTNAKNKQTKKAPLFP